MTYYLDVFSPETYARFANSDRRVTGFKRRQQRLARQLQAGDILVAYMTRLSRWVGLMRVTGPLYEDASPIFAEENDPYVLRVPVEPLVWLDPEHAIPIHEREVWSRLSITREHEHSSALWTGFFRSSLRTFTQEDGAFLESQLRAQVDRQRSYQLTEQERRRLSPQIVRRADGAVAVSVPEDEDEEEEAGRQVATGAAPRESSRVQALLARIGSVMGLRIWLPVNDRGSVLRHWEDEHGSLVAQLPLNYDTTTLQTIERIDVLWLKGRSIVRAFEVEHTTAIYSGLLRMADLLSLQPNMDIKLHIVAPEARKLKVFDEIRRPVFSFLDRGPLAESCTFMSYDSVRELASLPHLAHTSPTILDEYAEDAE